MGWTDRPLHEFRIGRNRYGNPDPDWPATEPVMAETRVTLAGCLTGANACPPADVGGPGGYQEFLEAMGNPRHKAHRQMLGGLEADMIAIASIATPATLPCATLRYERLAGAESI